MTLAAKPEHVEKGEWLAHQGGQTSFENVRGSRADNGLQVVEQYRLLESMIKVIQEVDSRTHLPNCNPTTCPTMSAAECVPFLP